MTPKQFAEKYYPSAKYIHIVSDYEGTPLLNIYDAEGNEIFCEGDFWTFTHNSKNEDEKRYLELVNSYHEEGLYIL